MSKQGYEFRAITPRSKTAALVGAMRSERMTLTAGQRRAIRSSSRSGAGPIKRVAAKSDR